MAREGELARRGALLGGALAEQGGGGLIAGEAGSGTSALLDEFAPRAAGNKAPLTSDRCTVFMERDVMAYQQRGARREDLEQYIKRLKSLEAVANAHQGVESSFAIQAGREVRVIVHPDKIDDAGAMRLARDISKRIQDELQFPGQIKVVVIREKRCIEYAR